jgi:hypothetical protein
MDHDDLRQETQRQLVELLIRDLDRALGFVRVAERHSEWGGRDGYQGLVQNARTALDTARRLEENVTDTEDRGRIDARANELDLLLSELLA